MGLSAKILSSVFANNKATGHLSLVFANNKGAGPACADASTQTDLRLCYLLF